MPEHAQMCADRTHRDL